MEESFSRLITLVVNHSSLWCEYNSRLHGEWDINRERGNYRINSGNNQEDHTLQLSSPKDYRSTDMEILEVMLTHGKVLNDKLGTRDSMALERESREYSHTDLNDFNNILSRESEGLFSNGISLTSGSVNFMRIEGKYESHYLVAFVDGNYVQVVNSHKSSRGTRTTRVTLNRFKEILTELKTINKKSKLSDDDIDRVWLLQYELTGWIRSGKGKTRGSSQRSKTLRDHSAVTLKESKHMSIATVSDCTDFIGRIATYLDTVVRPFVEDRQVLNEVTQYEEMTETLIYEVYIMKSTSNSSSKPESKGDYKTATTPAYQVLNDELRGDTHSSDLHEQLPDDRQLPNSLDLSYSKILESVPRYVRD